MDKYLQTRRLSWRYIKKELLGRSVVTACGLFIIILTLFLVFFIASQGIDLFKDNHVSLSHFLFSTSWHPDRDQAPQVGALIFIVGSIVISLLALALSTPFSVGLAIFMTEISPGLGKKVLQPAIEIFVGIPSVVYGWVGLSLLVPFIRTHIGGMGFSVLAGGLVLALMIFPTITSISADTLRSLPHHYKEASLALGATRWQTIRRILLPSATPGILTGVVLGLARAFGEALAVQMVIGNTIKIPGSLLQPTTNLTSIMTMDMGNTVMGTMWNNALWSMALLLFIISFSFILLIRKLGAIGAMTK
ncbi:phosphate abc transporter permease protein pstc [Lucifera butyrica]|uniref:Phosphate transport system permease protein n=1 Tax=Lucifera butyrica TaxID=1351585 RepID=A0A498R5K2_9FIRM|nr:phosphate ABC transporter permease subunit PstC [Lucifera butyrica]VBB06385.1 phosphate abc transporter permease protein pstc [Lucifera butyrica]